MRNLFLSLLFVFSTPLLAHEQSCLLSKYNRYANAQTSWQNSLTQLIKNTDPKLSDVAELYLNDQLILIQKNLMAVTLLLAGSPDKLKTKNKVNRWLSLDNLENALLASQNAEFANLLKKHTANQKRKPHHDGDKLRKIMRSQVVNSDSFKSLYSNYSNEVAAINKIICSVEQKSN